MNPSLEIPPRAQAVLSLIGNTPLVPLHFSPENLTLWAKCEFLNPSGSIKDRLAKTVLLDAAKRGLLRSDSIILECTSGNTGIALSMLGTAMGCRVTILISGEQCRGRPVLEISQMTFHAPPITPTST
jgi:cysteine synthase